MTIENFPQRLGARLNAAALSVSFLLSACGVSKNINGNVASVLSSVNVESVSGNVESGSVSMNLEQMDQDQLLRLFINESELNQYVEKYIASKNLNDSDAKKLRKILRLVELRMEVFYNINLGQEAIDSKLLDKVVQAIEALCTLKCDLRELVKSILVEKKSMEEMANAIRRVVPDLSFVGEDARETGSQLYTYFIDKFKDFKKYKALKNEIIGENEIEFAFFRTPEGGRMLNSFASLEVIARYAANVIDSSVVDDNYGDDVMRFFIYMNTNVSQEKLGLKMFDVLGDLETVFLNVTKLKNVDALNDDLKRLLNKLRYEQDFEGFIALVDQLVKGSNAALREALRTDSLGRFGVLANSVTDKDYISGLTFYNIYKTKFQNYDAYAGTNINFGSFEFFKTNDGAMMLEQFQSLKEIADYATAEIENADPNSDDQHRDFYYYFLYEVSKMNLGLDTFDIIDNINISLNNLQNLERFNVKIDSFNTLLNQLRDEKDLNKFKVLLNELARKSAVVLRRVELPIR